MLSCPVITLSSHCFASLPQTWGEILGLVSRSLAVIECIIHCVQAIALLDTLDKDVNTFVMRVREWYSWHFPELVRIVPDNYQYARLTLAVQNKSELTDDRKGELTDITGAHHVHKISAKPFGQHVLHCGPITLTDGQLSTTDGQVPRLGSTC